ncbi:SRPBCC family protein [Lentzea sp. BCCO 10_0061]|uniref:SRPBCC family protein n=1 Tax=Lentzea sokolovensis TaxID=3095429 RepID=A0ABU4UTM0_9PSEU|nr:SRPBCC family protein [Lentzea sp. BCCO 10_0061]MDX8142855.1 SRPBCC family protein [Lentzea sp. BCCO 10_0061]
MTTVKFGTTVTLPSDTEIAMSRSFDAPASLVWKAFTTPELLRRWLLGPDGWDMPICEVDLRVGGQWRYGWAQPDGSGAFEMHGEYTEVTPHSRIVNTEIFEDNPPAVSTVEFVEVDGQTTMTTTMRLVSQEARDAVLATGMADGAGRSYERLGEVLATL